MANHKYLKEAGFDKEAWGDTLPKNDRRRPEWTKERRIYGFDERETWSLKDDSLYWLYEHIKMYMEVSDVNLNYHKFDVDGEEMTQSQILNEILKKIKIYYNINNCFYSEYGEGLVGLSSSDLWVMQPEIAKKIWHLWGIVFPAMWW